MKNQRNLRIIITAALGLFCAPLVVGSPDVFVVLAMRQNLMGQYVHDNSYVFRATEFEVTRNSNFFDPPSSRVRLGHFRSVERAKDYFFEMRRFRARYNEHTGRRAQWEKKLGLSKSAQESKGEHDFQYLLDGKSIKPKPREREWIEEFTETIWLGNGLLALDAVEVELQRPQTVKITSLKNGVKGAEKQTTLAQLQCSEHATKVWRCVIPDFGQVFLKEL